MEDGGMSLHCHLRFRLTNCTFENNDSTYDGGAIYTEALNEPLIKDCTFKNNKANNVSAARSQQMLLWFPAAS